MSALVLIFSLVAAIIGPVVLLPYLARFLARQIGSRLRERTETRRVLLLKRAREEDQESPLSAKDRLATGQINEKPAHEWEGIIGFFHPFWYEDFD